MYEQNLGQSFFNIFKMLKVKLRINLNHHVTKRMFKNNLLHIISLIFFPQMRYS